MKRHSFHLIPGALAVLWLAGCSSFGPSAHFSPLFPNDGIPAGWTVTDWADVKNPPPAGAVWKVENGVLHGSEPRGTWLVSEKEYGDFALTFEWKLGDRGNSGCALRTPLAGDPAFDGMELQMVDPRYYPPDQSVSAAELSGALYRAVAPTVQAYRPNDWNEYQIVCRGPNITVHLNGVLIQQVNLDHEITHPTRHDGSAAPSLRDRPRRGHIGFQELSRGGGHVQIRHAIIQEL